jgi:DnaJ-class molecular chaperone
MPGDLIFKLVQEPHPFFTRKGDDLHMDLKITLKESILGFKKRVRHLDNHYVEIESS